MLFGAGQLRQVPVDVFPEFAPPRVEIQTPALGLSAEEVESLVTVPLEQALSGVPGLDILRSKSVPQLSSIELIFKPGPTCSRPASWSQERMSSGDRDAAHLGRTAGHDAARCRRPAGS